MTWLDGISSMFVEFEQDREAWCAAVHGVSKSQTWLSILVTQSCPTLWNPRDSSPPGSLSMRIPQAKILELVSKPSSREFSQPRYWTQVSCIAGTFFTAESLERSKNTGVGTLPFSRGTSQPRNWTGVFCITGGFFTRWATREARYIHTMEYYSALKRERHSDTGYKTDESGRHRCYLI